MIFDTQVYSCIALPQATINKHYWPNTDVIHSMVTDSHPVSSDEQCGVRQRRVPSPQRHLHVWQLQRQLHTDAAHVTDTGRYSGTNCSSPPRHCLVVPSVCTVHGVLAHTLNS